MNIGYITVELVTTFMVLSGNSRLAFFRASHSAYWWWGYWVVS
ncbi:13819_t:CDS:2 [Racocetra persica]|uniref:13819_t:CDS:1 n=1 Tax=Racocetra persica TaxID=160502 RepID=A0ACA9KD03_9GLOM|nr:13819_t:CDS:2 [Racocetra persica]